MPRPGAIRATSSGRAHTLVIGSVHAATARRAEVLGVDRAQLDTNPLAGTPAQIVDRLGQWRERAGVSRVHLQILDLTDLDQLELVAAEVAPQLD